MFRPLCSGWGLEFDLSSKDRLCEPEGVLGRRGSYLPTVAWLTSTPSLRFAMDARCALVRISQENFLQGADPCRKPEQNLHQRDQSVTSPRRGREPSSDHILRPTATHLQGQRGKALPPNSDLMSGHPGLAALCNCSHSLVEDCALMRAVGNFLGLLRHASRRGRTYFGGNTVSGSAVSPFNVIDEAHPDVLVDRAPVGQDVHSVTGRVGFACADFQCSRAHWAQGRGFRQLHHCLHASQQPDPARATRRESMSGRATHQSSKNIFVRKLLKTKFSHCSFVSTV